MDSCDGVYEFGGPKKTQLFDEKSYKVIEKNEKDSLRLMANCVILVNATILRERKLIPEDQFIEYPVYGNVTGFMVEEETDLGKRLAAKLNACRNTIEKKMLHKLAIVVEEEIHAGSKETFLWSFTYDTSLATVSASIGFGGEKSMFNVNYEDMYDTCRQFCSMFRKLQTVLEQLEPLPIGMIPSIKVAYRGEPEFADGFQSVPEFVKLADNSIDAVAFPRNTKFQIAYESRYLKKSNEQIGDPEVEEVGLRKNSTYDAEIETVRNDTMNHENFDFSHHSEDEREPIVNRNDSVDCNPNNTTKSDERRVLQSEYVSERLISRPRDVPQEVEMESEKLEHQDKDEAVLPEKLAKKGSKRSQIARKRREYEVLPKDARDASKPQKKKCARRLMKPIDETNCSEEGRSTQTIEIDRDQNIISLDQNLNETVEPKKKKTCRSPVTKSVIPEADELIATNLGTSKSNDVHKTETYGRVKSLKELCHDISREPEQATRQIETRENTPKRLQYGRSCNIVDPKKEKAKGDAANNEKEDPTHLVGNYARIPSLLRLTNQVVSTQKPLSRSNSLVKPTRSYGRIPSLLSLVETSGNQTKSKIPVQSSEITISEPLRNKYARVRSLKGKTEKQSERYGHSAPLTR